jgi:hypothetical protein
MSRASLGSAWGPTLGPVWGLFGSCLGSSVGPLWGLSGAMSGACLVHQSVVSLWHRSGASLGPFWGTTLGHHSGASRG